MQSNTVHDVVIVGSGFSGLGLAVTLARTEDISFTVLERANNIGGTWRDNTYPGAACDIQSHLYSYSFAPNPDWSRVYATQPEILAYLHDVAEKENVLPHIHFNAEMTEATWDEVDSIWTVTSTAGIFRTRVLVTASGHLSDPKMPDTPGINDFAGKIFHSARWDHDVNLTGKRIGVVGTGASAIQVIPEIAKSANKLTVFQRSAPYIIPRNDREYTDAEKGLFRKFPDAAQELRDELFWGNESRFPQRRQVPAFIDQIKDTALTHLKNQVTDPELYHKVLPDYEIGCKRILISNDYYPALSKENVDLKSVSVEQVTESGVITADGDHVELDALVLCTGFEASDLPIAYRISGRDGRKLSEHWSTGGKAFACTTVSGFPNLFVMLGPNTGLGAGSIIYMVETQIQYIQQAISFIKAELAVLEISTEVEDAFIDSVEERSRGTVWTEGGCASWYVDPRSNRLTTLWPDFMSEFRAENGTFSPDPYQVRNIEAGARERHHKEQSRI